MNNPNLSDYIHSKGTVVNTKGHKLLKFVSIEDGVTEILKSAKEANNFDMTLAEFVGGLRSTKKLATPDIGEFTLAPEGFVQLVKERLTFPPSAFSHKGITEATKLSMLGDLVSGEKGAIPVTVRTSEGKIYRVDPASRSFFDNKSLGMTVLNLYNQNMLPENTQFMTLGIAPHAVDMRLVSPDWNFVLGENGHSQNFMGNLVINNDPKITGVRAAVTRWECLNSTLGSAVCQLEQQYASYEMFLDLIAQGVTHIRAYTNEMMEQMSNFQQIQAESPLLIFAKIGEELGIPKYAMEGVQEYWRDQGEKDTLYDIVQSVVAGVQQVTAVKEYNEKGKKLKHVKLPNWGERARIEERIYGLALHLRELHIDGPGIDHYLECTKCHQRLPEPQEVVMN